jgi:hypothetical protein
MLDPTYEAFTTGLDTETERSMAAPPSSLQGLRVGVLSNGKANSRELLDVVVDELSRRPGVSIPARVRVVKSSFSVPPDPDDIGRLVDGTDLVLTAIGD